MCKRLLIIICFLVAVLFAGLASAAELHGPYARVQDRIISVGVSLSLSPEHAEEVRKGVAKEIIFYVDLFRAWTRWPDEFVLGKKIVQQLKCDPVKNENLLTTTVGSSVYLKRFSSCDELMSEGLSLVNVELSDIQKLEEGEYYIKVAAESRIRELPPVINLLLFFVEETEFTLESESPSFPLRR